MSVTYELPAKVSGDKLRADQRMYNDLIDSIESTGAKWPRQSVSSGQSFIKALSSTLWYIDPHHNTLRQRGVVIPNLFKKFSGYNDYKRKKEKKPQLSQLVLNQHVQLLGEYLSQPWFCRSIYSNLRTDTEKLAEGLRKYEHYLRDSSERVNRLHHLTELIRSPVDNVILKTVLSSSEPVKLVYSELAKAFDQLPDYQPVLTSTSLCFDVVSISSW